MSIPLDRLYHYIESVAQECCQDNVLIYRFFPHGSKKIEDLTVLGNEIPKNWKNFSFDPHIFCNDQEILNFDLYQNLDFEALQDSPEFKNQLQKTLVEVPNYNLRIDALDIYDHCILLHSENRSIELEKYKKKYFIPVYYWSHALLALDWFRFAKHANFDKNQNSRLFLIYNRAWSGTREYRLKFTDWLIEYDLVNQCQTTCNVVDPELNIKFTDHNFKNTAWKPTHCLENYFLPTQVGSYASADFVINDYNNTDFEVVLETLFDDSRLHLTEKILRPIACGQPFLLAGTHGSLQYLRNYGFKTFSEVIDESYDLIVDPEQRLLAIIKLMEHIKSWNSNQRKFNMQKIKEIANYNRCYFFSDEFFNCITDELKNNLKHGLTELLETNTGQRFFNRRRTLCQDPVLKSIMTNSTNFRSRQDMAYIVQQARKYYNRYLKTLNK
jgi:hypothetical protein